MVQSPFTQTTVQRLNEIQAGVSRQCDQHRLTCANRAGVPHGSEGGDLGVLIATEQGWVCPHCDHTQSWADDAAETLTPLAIIGNGQVRVLGDRARIEAVLATRLTEYEALVEKRARGAEVMVACLQRRRAELAAPPPTLTMWVVYESPSDYPGQMVARRFEIAGGKESPTQDVLIAPTLDALRDLSPPGLAVIARSPSDDPVIVECWI